MLGITGRIRSLISIFMIFALIFMSFPSLAQSAYDYEDTLTIFAGKTIPVGSAHVIIDNGQLTISVEMYEGYPADEYHLYILPDLPVERPAPGRDPDSSNDELGGIMAFMIGPIDLKLEDLSPGQCIDMYILLHIETGDETAYPGTLVDPEPDKDTDNNAWFRYIPVRICKERPSIDLEKLVNGEDADSPTGPIIPVGSMVTFDFVVTNDGDVTLHDITVTDDVFGAIGTIPSLAPGASQTLTIARPAVLGQHTNTGTASDGHISDSDPANYLGEIVPLPSIDLEKFVNGEDADSPTGPHVMVDSPVTFDFVVTNTGDVELTNVVVTDDVYGTIGTIPYIAVGTYEYLTKTVPAVLGQHTNTATATAAEGVSDTDPANYFGDPLPEPSIDLEKYVNGQDADTPTGPHVMVGSPVTFDFVVTNTGIVDLTNVVVTDDVYGTIGIIPHIAIGTYEYLTKTVPAVTGQHINIATATAAEGVSDTDPGNYFGDPIPAPAIDLEKLTNGEDADLPTGPHIPVGNPVNWTYVVTNTGNVTLTGISVVDDMGVTVSIPKTTLAPGESMTGTASGIAVAGQYANIGTATGTPPVGGSVSASDPSHYFGSDPSIDIEKSTNGYDADLPTGPHIPVGDPVIWTYVVTNTGNVTLTGIFVVDDMGVTVTIPKTTLAPSESMTGTASGIAVAGQYANIGTATGTPPVGGNVTDSDPSNYYGDPAPEYAIDIEKFVNSEDADTSPGPHVYIGSTVTFDFVVTNIGDLDLTNIVVTDDIYGSIGTIPRLEPDEEFTFTITHFASSGQHTNTATATAAEEVSDSDPGNYFGDTTPEPAIDLEKYVNGEDADTPTGPHIMVGSPVIFDFIVINMGNVDLTNVIITDDVYGASDVIPLIPVGYGAYLSFIEPAEAGQHTNIATVTTAEGVSDTDPANYYGDPEPEYAIDLEKYVNGEDADSPTGPRIRIGSTVTFDFVVTNSGDLDLTDIVVTDDIYGQIGNIPELSPGEDYTFTITRTSTSGQHANTATATAAEGVSDTDMAHYYGRRDIDRDPDISIKKYVSVDGGETWHDADNPTGPKASYPGTVQFKVVVKNTGDYRLTDIEVTDTDITFTGISSSLDSGDSDTSDIITIDSINGQHSNTAEVEGFYGSQKVTDSDMAHYYTKDDDNEKGKIKLHKFMDENENGTQDTGEFHMENVTFELYNSDKSEKLSTKQTDFEGNLTFTNLDFGTYYLKELSEYDITTSGFDADGFMKVIVDSEETISIIVGNDTDRRRDSDNFEIIEEPVPLALPQSGEKPPTSFYILGALLMLAGMFLKRFE